MTRKTTTTKTNSKRLFLQIEINRDQQKLFRKVATARGLKVATWARSMLIDRAFADKLGGAKPTP